MKHNIETLRHIKEQALAENHRYCDSLSVIGTLYTDGKIALEDFKRIEAAVQPYRERTAAIVDAASHALTNAVIASRPQLPFAPTPKPLTTEEEAILDQAVADYINIEVC